MNVCLCSHLALHTHTHIAPPPTLVDLLCEDSGQDVIEYALISCFIGLATVTGIHGLAAEISGYFNIVTSGFLNSLQ